MVMGRKAMLKIITGFRPMVQIIFEESEEPRSCVARGSAMFTPTIKVGRELGLFMKESILPLT
jgi:hypothetical protein